MAGDFKREASRGREEGATVEKFFFFIILYKKNLNFVCMSGVGDITFQF